MTVGLSKPQWLRKIRPYADIFFPRVCVLCNRVLVNEMNESICMGCLDELVPDKNVCQKCSAPVPLSFAENPKKCRLCKSDWMFHRAYSMCTYRSSAAKAARRMKSIKHESLTAEIGQKMGIWFAESAAGRPTYVAIVPIPQYWVRKWVTKYNQAAVLAEMVSRVTRIPIESRWLYRCKWTEKQGTKTIEERLITARDSFAVSKPKAVQGKTILLVDDILTSGATASDAARALRSAGAERVDVLVFARGANAT